MLHFRFKPGELDDAEKTIYGVGAADGVRTRQRECKIFLGLTSNLVSSGMRESIKFIVKHKMVDVVCVTAGGVEEDLIKCLAPTHIGDGHMPGADLRNRGWSTFCSHSRSNRQSDRSEQELLSLSGVAHTDFGQTH
jgi:deoxyhypusine synthase